MATKTFTGIPDKDIITKLWDKIKAKFVAQETGKGLSSNDFTDSYKSKVDEAYSKPSDGIPETDLSNDVQTKLNASGKISYYYILDNPSVSDIKSDYLSGKTVMLESLQKIYLLSKVTKEGGLDTVIFSNVSDNDIAILKKYDGSDTWSSEIHDISDWDTAYTHSQSTHAPTNAQKNVQSDWNATSGDAFIKNKPGVSSTSAAGLCPKLGGGTKNYLRADGSWHNPVSDYLKVNVGFISVSGGAQSINLKSKLGVNVAYVIAVIPYGTNNRCSISVTDGTASSYTIYYAPTSSFTGSILVVYVPA